MCMLYAMGCLVFCTCSDYPLFYSVHNGTVYAKLKLSNSYKKKKKNNLFTGNIKTCGTLQFFLNVVCYAHIFDSFLHSAVHMQRNELQHDALQKILS